MRRIKLASLMFCLSLAFLVCSQGKQPIIAQSNPFAQTSATEAPTGFDNKTNGMLEQVDFDADRESFLAVEDIDDGIGPVYNGLSCGECHGNPVTGGGSQVAVLRAGHFDGTKFEEHPGGSLIHSRAVHPKIQERVFAGYEVRAFRLSLSILGDGFVEAVDDNTLLTIAKEQPNKSGGRIKGEAIYVPIEEAPGIKRIGRFGWKCQQASLLSFSGDAYVNEMGITTPLFPVENTSNGRAIDKYDPVPDPDEGDNDDIEAFTRFIRSTKAPSRDAELAASPAGVSGEKLFNDIGCAICHVPTMQTLPAGFVINGGMFTIPPALGDKVFHPFGDFLLHDIGTGDGIVQNGGLGTRNKMRTAPLWGLRARNQLMHDGASLTYEEAIKRHGGEADFVTTKFKALTKKQKNDLYEFLNSL
ncbi:MAG: hypothetical protein K1Y36_15440 [Blastocatellia bacterium]|nr:hypothetical protein [Blastocatellia bacterium]